MAGGSSINSDRAEQQRAFGIIVYNDLRPPLLIRQAPDHYGTYMPDILRAFGFSHLRNVFSLIYSKSKISRRSG